ncbi:MAG: adenylate/guanylate cyclase domain-containing protein [Dehalococcoidales bacterium]|nr:adenylate/guanylate cyclase domain-containing protein [Dehalococcoidales bacterium]
MKRRYYKRVRRRIPTVQKAREYEQSNGLIIINKDIFDKFNPSLLRLGDIKTPCQEKEAVAAVFDLSGFTSFCNQVDAYLAIPTFLNSFYEWFFSSIAYGLTDEDGDNTRFWAELPTLVKFLGDGLLVVWNAHSMNDEQICRLAATLYNICRAYRQDFYPQIKMEINKPPGVLRCGMARGKVFTIGNGSDYIGHCINTASRLSNLSPLTFCFPRRGFPLQENLSPQYSQQFIPKYVSIRGVGDDEPVWVVKEEFIQLNEKQKIQYRSVDNGMVRVAAA